MHHNNVDFGEGIRVLHLSTLMVCRLQITALSEYALFLSDERSSVFRNIYLPIRLSTHASSQYGQFW